jgi:hypothetical protein
MHGTLCDAYIFDHDRGHFSLLEDFPVNLLAQSSDHASTTRIEFSFTFDNPADSVERERFTPGGLLHPRIRLFVEGDLIHDVHMYEDVYAEWEKDEFGFCFRKPLKRFVAAVESAHRPLLASNL